MKETERMKGESILVFSLGYTGNVFVMYLLLFLCAGERREWIKPIMFSGGIGSIDKHLVHKQPPKAGMIVTKVGGPVYRIGVGGGAASSVQVQGKH